MDTFKLVSDYSNFFLIIMNKRPIKLLSELWKEVVNEFIIWHLFKCFCWLLRVFLCVRSIENTRLFFWDNFGNFLKKIVKIFCDTFTKIWWCFYKNWSGKHYGTKEMLKIRQNCSFNTSIWDITFQKIFVFFSRKESIKIVENFVNFFFWPNLSLVKEILKYFCYHNYECLPVPIGNWNWFVFLSLRKYSLCNLWIKFYFRGRKRFLERLFMWFTGHKEFLRVNRC